MSTASRNLHGVFFLALSSAASTHCATVPGDVAERVPANDPATPAATITPVIAPLEVTRTPPTTQPVEPMTPPPGSIAIRVAHFASELPAFDVCVAPRGATEFADGPWMFAIGDARGLDFGDVSAYRSIVSGAYALRLVPAGATSCGDAMPGVSDLTILANATGGAALTLAITSDPSRAGGLMVQHVTDDTGANDSANARVRFVHAAPHIAPLDLGDLDRATFAAIGGSDFALARTAEDGVSTVVPSDSTRFALRLRGTEPAEAAAYPLVLDSMPVAAGSRTTIFAVGDGATTSPLLAVVCDEDMVEAGGARTACRTLPERTFVRVANLVARSANFDLCFATAEGDFVGPVLGDASVGVLDYPSVSRYLAIPPGAERVRIVSAHAHDCTHGSFDDLYTPRMLAGQWLTLASVGSARAPSIRIFADSHRPSAVAAAGVRFVNASPAPTPSLDFGAGEGAAFSALFADVSFAQSGSDPFADANGFVAVPSGTMSAGLRVHRDSTPMLSASVRIEPGSMNTVFAIGRADVPAGSPEEVGLLVCSDRSETTGGRASCVVRGRSLGL